MEYKAKLICQLAHKLDNLEEERDSLQVALAQRDKEREELLPLKAQLKQEQAKFSQLQEQFRQSTRIKLELKHQLDHERAKVPHSPPPEVISARELGQIAQKLQSTQLDPILNTIELVTMNSGLNYNADKLKLNATTRLLQQDEVAYRYRGFESRLTGYKLGGFLIVSDDEYEMFKRSQTPF